jgi:uncharacterized OB-fold protein
MTEPARSLLQIYQDHLKNGELAYQYSIAADRAVFYPRLVCPFTGDERLEWRVSAGLGAVYSTTTVHPRDGEPYNVALVDVDEGFRLMTRVEAISADDVKIGLRVKFARCGLDGDELYPIFHPV